MNAEPTQSAIEAGRGAHPFDFARPVARNGYVWWYVDALSSDGRHGITLIALIGSVFSPYYARARRHGAGDPLDHCALNVALYGEGGKCWAMTERGHAGLRREAASLCIGPSTLHWNGEALVFDIDEVTVPLPSRIRGRVQVYPRALNGHVFELDRQGLHRWQPYSPGARVEVALSRPALRWTGIGYVDGNSGDVPLEHTFSGWHWSRAALGDGGTAVLYDVLEDNAGSTLALRFNRAGGFDAFTPPPVRALPRTGWRIGRETRAETTDVQVLQTLEDTPFYARSTITTRLLGESMIAMHESLALTRFSARWVQRLLPFRMPRRPA
jgi:carotenoid 1,2-hydratase